MNVEFDFPKETQAHVFVQTLQEGNISCSIKANGNQFTVLATNVDQDQYNHACIIRSALITPINVAEAIGAGAARLDTATGFVLDNIAVPLVKATGKGLFKVGFSLLKTTGKLAAYLGGEIMHQGSSAMQEIKNSQEMNHLKTNFGAAAKTNKSIRIVP